MVKKRYMLTEAPTNVSLAPAGPETYWFEGMPVHADEHAVLQRMLEETRADLDRQLSRPFRNPPMEAIYRFVTGRARRRDVQIVSEWLFASSWTDRESLEMVEYRGFRKVQDDLWKMSTIEAVRGWGGWMVAADGGRPLFARSFSSVEEAVDFYHSWEAQRGE